MSAFHKSDATRLKAPSVMRPFTTKSTKIQTQVNELDPVDVALFASVGVHLRFMLLAYV